MRRRATISALLLIGLGVVSGATVFRSDIAQATGLAQSVTVNNTAANPVPVTEQNLDNGDIKVHEEGTANVKVVNHLVPVHEVGTAAVSSANDDVAVTKFIQNTTGDGCNGDLYTVPAAKELVVEYVSAAIGSDFHAASAGGFIVSTSNALLPLVFSGQNTASFAASEAVHYVFPAGEVIGFRASIENADSSGAELCIGQFSLGGYLQPSS